jgi:DNA-binding response OmpR family regulator
MNGITPPARTTVLVVEDDRVIADAVARRLEASGYVVHVRYDGRSAVAAVESDETDAGGGLRPDLVVLDLGLPGIDGIEVCRRVQARRPVPVLMLTARGEEADRVAGLTAGADDYLVKPFSPRELVARVAALLRRVERAAALAAGSEPRDLVVGDLHVDRAHRRVTVAVRGRDHEPDLTRTEFDLLWALARRAGEVVDRSTLLVEALRWSPPAASAASPAAVRSVDSHVKAVRRKIGRDRIRTVAGVGYALEPGPVGR